MLQKVSRYVNCFHETNYMSFLLKIINSKKNVRSGKKSVIVLEANLIASHVHGKLSKLKSYKGKLNAHFNDNRIPELYLFISNTN